MAELNPKSLRSAFVVTTSTVVSDSSAGCVILNTVICKFSYPLTAGLRSTCQKTKVKDHSAISGAKCSHKDNLPPVAGFHAKNQNRYSGRAWG